MSEPVTLPAPVLTPPEPRNKWERERRAFLRLLPELLNTHRGQYVAVHEERVVDAGDELVPLAMRVYAAHGYVPVYIDLITEKPQVERIPHRREL